MWDYDKLFTVGNVICVGDIISSVDEFNIMDWRDNYANKELTHKALSNGKIQYIIRLDGHGNVVEKLFDRERDMESKPEPMPELKTGMFVRVAGYDDSGSLGFIDVENNHIIYQSGGYDYIKDEQYSEGVMYNIIEVYDKSARCFDGCRSKNHLIWKDPKYKACS